MKPIRVLQVVTIMNRGGLETMLMNYYRKLDRSKIQFDFMVHREERGDYDDEIEALGGKIFRMCKIRPGNYKKYFKELDDFFIKHDYYKVIHAHINENSGFVLRAAKKLDIPCRISHSHLAGMPIDYKLPFRLYARSCLNKNATNFFACSKEAAQWLFGNDISESDDLVIFKNAIDCDEFSFKQSERDRIRHELNLKDKFVIGHVGRFNSQKNHKFLIDIFNEICKIKDDALLLLVGEGTLEDEIKKKVTKLNLDKKVRFLGLRSDISSIVQGMDIFLFPSLYEGLGVVLIEAQASGLKCITSTGTPKEADVTESVEFIDLNEGAKKWAEIVVSVNNDRIDRSDYIKARGYSVIENIKWLSNFYLGYYS